MALSLLGKDWAMAHQREALDASLSRLRQLGQEIWKSQDALAAPPIEIVLEHDVAPDADQACGAE
jgi:hypothetical protein